MRGKHAFRRGLLVLAALAPGLTGNVVRADIYRYRDANGVEHYTNVPSRRPHGEPHDQRRPRTRGTHKPERSPHAVPAAPPTRKCVPKRGRRYRRHVREAARVYRLPEAFLWATMQAASDFAPGVGLMGASMKTLSEMGVLDALEPRQNILGGARYLRVLANELNGDLVLTISTYFFPSAPGRVPKAAAQTVRKVLTYYYRFRECFIEHRGAVELRVRFVNSRPPEGAASIYSRIRPSVFMVVTDAGRQGSAVAVTDSHLVTNAHVVDGAKHDVILLQENSARRAKVIRFDKKTDRALLEVVGPGPALLAIPGLRRFADTLVGEEAYTLGYALAEETFADGMVSGKRHGKRTSGLQIIQTSAPISPGSSGGGLFDKSGNLLGITTRARVDANLPQNHNYAIAAEEFLQWLD